jgi:hypothetical protein
MHLRYPVYFTSLHPRYDHVWVTKPYTVPVSSRGDFACSLRAGVQYLPVGSDRRRTAHRKHSVQNPRCVVSLGSLFISFVHAVSIYEQRAIVDKQPISKTASRTREVFQTLVRIFPLCIRPVSASKERSLANSS